MQATAEAIPGGSRAIWQIPSSPRAVLLVFHGLNHGPEVFWEASAGCPACAQAGLPEEHLITRTALARRYAVLTMAALMAVGWDKRPDLAGNVDFRQLAAYLPAWTARHGLDGLPVAAFGVSRGGEFASLVPLGLPRVVSLVLMVDAGNDAAVAAAQGVGGEGGLAPYPPTLFIYMPKDKMTSASVTRNAGALAAKGVPTATVACNPFPVYDTFFSERVSGLDAAVSAALVRALRAKGYLTPDGYVSKPDPVSWENYGHWDWSRVVKMLRVAPAASREEQVAEELSLSFAFHCCSGLKADEMMHWLDAAVDGGTRHTAVAAA